MSEIEADKRTQTVQEACLFMMDPSTRIIAGGCYSVISQGLSFTCQPDDFQYQEGSLLCVDRCPQADRRNRFDKYGM